MKAKLFVLLWGALSFLLIPLNVAAVVKIACVGDSVTYGYKIADRELDAYPAQLQRLLGSGYEVDNFGVNGTTLLRRGHRPYSLTDTFKAALAFHPDIVVIHLGSNDTDPRDWPNYRDGFRADYSWLIGQFREANPAVRIYLCILTPIFESHPRFKSSTRDWAQEIRDEIPQIAKSNHARLIDLQRPLSSRPDLFSDAVHPDAEGASIIANTVYQSLTGNYGGLRLPEGYGDLMVLERGEPLRIQGTANRGQSVRFQFRQIAWQAIADWNGNWSITIPAQKAGGPYLLRFSTPEQSISLKDVYFGELWLCSGQSNMDFPVSMSAEANVAVNMAANKPVIRLLHYKNAAPTTPVAWNKDVLQKVNRLQFFSGQWEMLNSADVNDFSAVGYFFAQRLYRKLKVPIGIIQVSVGGSPAASWIDRRTMDDDPLLVDMMANWRNSDFIMDWCRKRAAQNLANATNPLQQHPYEPSYNFEAGIAPILQMPIKGVIWYQGESDTNNVEIYEHLFPVLVKSWREQWGRNFPFYYVQISGLDRPSWPRFRDAQRQLLNDIPNSGMVVSSDLGEPYNVHYSRKKPVGDRLANLVLQKVYRMPGVHGESPIGFEAIRQGSEVRIEFRNSGGKLQASDGRTLRGFQLRDYLGNWRVVPARVDRDTVLLDGTNVNRAGAVAYAWQPFPDANLVNAYGLPASTFILKIR